MLQVCTTSLEQHGLPTGTSFGHLERQTVWQGNNNNKTNSDLPKPLFLAQRAVADEPGSCLMFTHHDISVTFLTVLLSL